MKKRFTRACILLVLCVCEILVGGLSSLLLLGLWYDFMQWSLVSISSQFDNKVIQVFLALLLCPAYLITLHGTYLVPMWAIDKLNDVILPKRKERT